MRSGIRDLHSSQTQVALGIISCSAHQLQKCIPVGICCRRGQRAQADIIIACRGLYNLINRLCLLRICYSIRRMLMQVVVHECERTDRDAERHTMPIGTKTTPTPDRMIRTWKDG